MDFDSNKNSDFLGFWNRVETLSIYLLKPKKDPKGQPLPIDDLLRTNKGRIIPKTTTTAEAGKVAVIWERHERPPRLAPNEIDVNVKNLDNIHFKKLTLTVK